jgi:hypothetical protein
MNRNTVGLFSGSTGDAVASRDITGFLQSRNIFLASG